MPEIDLSKSSGRMTKDNLVRLNRSTDGLRVLWHNPDWRYRQARIYFNAAKIANASGRDFYFPDWEGDELVMELYSYLANSSCSSSRMTETYHMVFDAYNNNANHGYSTRIKALTIADLSKYEIADKLMIDSDVVEVYQKTFWDVAHCLDNKPRLQSMLFPFSPDEQRGHSSADIREQLWIASAFYGGENLLRFFLEGYYDTTIEDVEKSIELITAMTTSKALEYSVMLKTDGVARPSHLDKFLNMHEVQTRSIQAKTLATATERDREGGEQERRFREFLENVGVKSAGNQSFTGTGDSRVTTLSISELRKIEVMSKEGESDKKKTRILDVESGLGISSYED